MIYLAWRLNVIVEVQYKIKHYTRNTTIQMSMDIVRVLLLATHQPDPSTLPDNATTASSATAEDNSQDL